MEIAVNRFKTVEEYFTAAPTVSKERLGQLRAAVKKLLPGIQEVISYNMPAFRNEHGIVAWYAGYKHHLGLYPSPSGIAAFKEQLTGYKFSKGSIQFPLDRPLPMTLIKKIIKFRAAEIAEKQKAKKR